MPNPDDYVYKLHIVRPDSKVHYWKGKVVRGKIMSYRAAKATVEAQKQYKEPYRDQITVQRALIGEWEEIDLDAPAPTPVQWDEIDTGVNGVGS